VAQRRCRRGKSRPGSRALFALAIAATPRSPPITSRLVPARGGDLAARSPGVARRWAPTRDRRGALGVRHLGRRAHALVGAGLIRCFREHHDAPRAMLDHDWIEVNCGARAAACVAFALLALPTARSGSTARVPRRVRVVARRDRRASRTRSTSGRTPRAAARVALLQRAGSSSSRAPRPPSSRAHDGDYCIAGGWLNPALDAIGFWRGSSARSRASRDAAPRRPTRLSRYRPDRTPAQRGTETMKLVEWLAKEVTDDPRALRWFAEPGSDERIARAYRELLAGYQIDPGAILKTTRMLEPGERPGSVEVNEIAFYSICAHHFLPFFGEVDIAYVPGDRILGLGKAAAPRRLRFARASRSRGPRARGGARDDGARARAAGARCARAHSTCACAAAVRSQSSITHTEFARGTLDGG
jgi:GTP cyclohydrolase I